MGYPICLCHYINPSAPWASPLSALKPLPPHYTPYMELSKKTTILATEEMLP